METLRFAPALGASPITLPTPTLPAAGVETSGTAGLVRLCAPLAGWLVPLSEVPDPVFADRILGDGFAIDPTEATLHAPFDGVVTSLHRAHHAVTLRATGGVEILMHIGLDTVALKGEGFTAHVAEGDTVAAGAPLISFDMDVLAQLVRSLLVPIVVTNGDAFTASKAETGRLVSAGDVLVEIRPAGTGEPVGSSAAAAATSDDMVRRAAAITDPSGMHARPAGLLADFAKSCAARVTLSLGDRTADARSAVSLMLLGAEQGDVVVVEAIGPDAETAATRIAAMLGTPVEVDGPSTPARSAVAGPSRVREQAPAPVVVATAPPLETGAPLDFAGVTAAPGLAVGEARRLVHAAPAVAETGSDASHEATALDEALARARAALEVAITAQGADAGPRAAILAAHLAFLGDPELRAAADDLIAAGKSAGFAWKTAIDTRVAALRALGKPLLAERAADLLDIQRRVLLDLSGDAVVTLDLPEGSILFAEDLLPSQFGDLDLTRVVGLVLAAGGPTSHVVILAASEGLPVLVAAGPDSLRVPDGATVILDADAGRVRINPPPEEVEAIGRTLANRRARAEANLAAAHDDCVMADGTRITVAANLGSAKDVAAALAHGAEGCGLLRSEFLFLDRATAPSEDEQLAAYQAIADALDGRPLIVRTLDAGADKKVAYADTGTDPNPALGMRGIRLSLARPDLLVPQIRAILRVEPFGRTRIMLPMVATLDDLRAVRRVIERESAALGRIAPIDVGIMVEVPSAALIADRFAAEADFFSVGTNDLTQYTLAMDRTNPRLAQRVDPLHPAVLRLIGMAAEAAQAKGRWTGVCGSIASQPTAAPILVGLGVTELSATPNAIPAVKALLRTLTLKRCAEVAREALRADDGEAVRRLAAQAWPDA